MYPSNHGRAVIAANDTAGLPEVKTLSLLAGCRYLLKDTFSDVLPLPNTSYAAPSRGVMSWNPFTPSFRGNTIGDVTKGPALRMPFSPSGNQLRAYS